MHKPNSLEKLKLKSNGENKYDLLVDVTTLQKIYVHSKFLSNTSIFT